MEQVPDTGNTSRSGARKILNYLETRMIVQAISVSLALAHMTTNMHLFGGNSFQFLVTRTFCYSLEHCVILLVFGYISCLLQLSGLYNMAMLPGCETSLSFQIVSVALLIPVRERLNGSCHLRQVCLTGNV